MCGEIESARRRPDDGRRTYQPSGRVNWPRLLAWAGQTAAVAMLAALAVDRCRAWCSADLFFVAVLLAYALVFGTAYLAIGGGHCRNRFIAWATMEWGGLVLLVSYGCLVLPPPRGAIEDVRSFDLFVLFLMIYTGLASLAAAATSRTYCETCGRWMRRQRVRLPAGTASALARALTRGKLSSFPEVSPVMTGSAQWKWYHGTGWARYELEPGPACDLVELDFCPGNAERTAPCETYLTLKEQKEDGAIRNVLLRQAALSREELKLLVDKVPPLIVAAAASSALSPEPCLTSAAYGSRPTGAVITSLPSWEAARVHSFGGEALDMLLSFTPVILTIGGVVLAVIGYREHPWAGGLVPVACLLAWLKLAAGGVGAIVGAVVCRTNVDFLNMRHRYAAVAKILRQRGDSLVHPDDPEAIYVHVVPRANWKGLDQTRSEDRGFLLLDPRRRQLLFEGIRQRYQVPGEALTACIVEPITLRGEPTSLYVTVIRAPLAEPASGRLPSGLPPLPWEAPLIAYPVKFEPYRKRHRYLRAVDLRDRIVMALHGSPGLPADELDHRPLAAEGGALELPAQSGFDEQEVAAERAVDPEAHDWTCGRCGESVPGNFEICWACGTSRERERDPGFPPPRRRSSEIVKLSPKIPGRLQFVCPGL